MKIYGIEIKDCHWDKIKNKVERVPMNDTVDEFINPSGVCLTDLDRLLKPYGYNILVSMEYKLSNLNIILETSKYTSNN